MRKTFLTLILLSIATLGFAQSGPVITDIAITTDAGTVHQTRLRPHVDGDPSWNSGTYSYDGSGNIKAIGTDQYVYDELSRLTNGTANQKSATSNTQSYTYDSFGNLTNVNTTGNMAYVLATMSSRAVDAATNHLTSVGGMTVYFDQAGRLRQWGTNAMWPQTGTPSGYVYEYDAVSMVTQETEGGPVHWNIYDANDERIVRYDGATWQWSLRDATGKVLRDVTSANTAGGFSNTAWTWSKDYVYREGLLLASVTPSGTNHFHLDHLGTPRLITDASANKVAYHTYYPFGTEVQIDTDAERMKFTGHERDTIGSGDNHSLDYMHSRYYGTGLGRFLSADPTWDSADLTKPQAWNRYSYVRNNPV